MKRRDVLTGIVAGSVGAVAPGLAGPEEAAAVTPTPQSPPRLAYANPLDEEMRENIESLEEAVARMKECLDVAQTTNPMLRDCMLSELRNAHGWARMVSQFIAEVAYKQAVELRPELYRGRDYGQHDRRFRALRALNDAGFSLREAAGLIYHDQAEAKGVAAAMEAGGKITG